MASEIKKENKGVYRQHYLRVFFNDERKSFQLLDDEGDGVYYKRHLPIAVKATGFGLAQTEQQPDHVRQS